MYVGIVEMNETWIQYYGIRDCDHPKCPSLLIMEMEEAWEQQQNQFARCRCTCVQKEGDMWSNWRLGSGVGRKT